VVPSPSTGGGFDDGEDLGNLGRDLKMEPQLRGDFEKTPPLGIGFGVGFDVCAPLTAGFPTLARFFFFRGRSSSLISSEDSSSSSGTYLLSPDSANLRFVVGVGLKVFWAYRSSGMSSSEGSSLEMSSSISSSDSSSESSCFGGWYRGSITLALLLVGGPAIGATGTVSRLADRGVVGVGGGTGSASWRPASALFARLANFGFLGLNIVVRCDGLIQAIELLVMGTTGV